MVQQWKPCSVALLTAIAAIVVLSAPALAQRTGPPGPIELNLGTEDGKERMAAMMEKREPVWRGF